MTSSDGARAAMLVARNVTRSVALAEHLEVADGLWGKFMGLMGRAGLEAGAGLWLPGENGIHMMFMRFPIDAVFVGRADPGHGGARPVRSVHPGLRAWTGLVPLVRGADGVLELPAGTIERSGTVVGDWIAVGPAASV
jgi:uncharacterized membrane protein (UPF0127 family)